MAPPIARRGRLLLACAEDSFRGLESALRAEGHPVARFTALTVTPVPPSRIRRRARTLGPIDGTVVTSRHAVDALVRVGLSRVFPRARSLPAFAVGAETARALRRAGFHRVRPAPDGGSAALLGVIDLPRGARLLRPRSDRAGSELRRALAARGYRAVDLVVYRVAPASRVDPRARAAALEANALAVSSPSALVGLRRALGARPFRALADRARAFVLGERTLRAAKRHGFTDVRVSPRASEQGFTAFLLQTLAEADDGRRTAGAARTTPSSSVARARARMGRRNRGRPGTRDLSSVRAPGRRASRAHRVASRRRAALAR